MDDFRELGGRLSNWGRWGVDGRRDERGTTNLLTPEKIVAAASPVRDGKVFDLGIPFGPGGPQPGGGRINPVQLLSETGADQDFPGAFHYADDYVFMPLQSASQWDGLEELIAPVGRAVLGELLEVEDLAQRHSHVPAPPIKFRRAVGSPINPLAIK
ncbi:hypothetical protein [Pseudonocardia sp.]|uniref:hypothetical protein n=1 Tax=Pseudonocardia sp. TaxID=60912 RepID=UPI0031FBE87E